MLKEKGRCHNIQMENRLWSRYVVISTGLSKLQSRTDHNFIEPHILSHMGTHHSPMAMLIGDTTSVYTIHHASPFTKLQ